MDFGVYIKLCFIELCLYIEMCKIKKKTFIRGNTDIFYNENICSASIIKYNYEYYINIKHIILISKNKLKKLRINVSII